MSKIVNELCIYCEEKIAGERIKNYKKLNCDLPWAFWPLCESHLSKKTWAATRKKLGEMGWERRWNRSWCRKDTRDWISKEL